MAESPSSALPGGVQWLPAIGGAHLLRAEVGRGDPPVLVLQSARGGEHRISAAPQSRFSRSADFLIPAGLRWSVAALVWPNGGRAVLPDPPDGRAEVIDLASRRPAPPAPPTPAPLPWTEPPWEVRAESAIPVSRVTDLGPSADAPADAGADTAIPASRVSAALTGAEAGAPPPRASAAISAFGAADPTGTDVGAEGYEAARADLKADLSRAVEALSHAHETEKAADDAVKAMIAGAHADLQAERAARAADLSVLGARSQLIALRAELDRAREEITRLRTALESERLARAAAEAALGSPVPAGDLTELAARQAEAAASVTRRSPEEADRLVAALAAAADTLRATVPPPVEHEPRGGVRSETLAQRKFSSAPAGVALPPGEAARPDTAAPAPLDAAETVDAPATPAAPARADEAVPSDASAALDAPARGDDAVPPDAPARADDAAAVDVAARLDVPAPGLRAALLTLARQEPVAAGALIAGLLPAQGAIVEEPLSYDLTVRGYGTFAVTIGSGGAEVQRLTQRRSRKQAAFHIAGDPLVLAELLAGERKRLGRFKPSARITGRRKRARALRAIPASTLSLAEAIQAGARLDPALIYAALPYAVAPEWTKGHVFTIAQEIRELGPRAWYVTARDGVRLSVVEHAAGAAADATVTMSRAAFDRLLKNEHPVSGDLPVIRGNRAAVATLKHWTDLARGQG